MPPILRYNAAGGSPLRHFNALPDSSVLVLGARRVPAIACPKSNTNTAVSILTSVGFQQVSADDFVEAAKTVRPDIVVGLADLPGHEKPSMKRLEKMSDRTGVWLRTLLEASPEAKVFAPVLPVAKELQSYYLADLEDEDIKKHISGLAIYDTDSLASLPEGLSQLPRLSLAEASTPSRLLREISLGMDIFTIPFIDAATDAGIALSFSFVPSSKPINGGPRLPLGIDMWSLSHAADLSPLVDGCMCYACQNHHRAYLQHLLSAKEMLGWVLLQVHNHHMMNQFFSAVRDSISKGTFEDDRTTFEATYQSELPEKTGQGPRIRGYQFKSEGPGEAKRNPSAYRSLNDASEKLAESAVPGPDIDATRLEESGLGRVA